VSVNWLILSYALQSIGELMISGSAWRWSLSWFLSVSVNWLILSYALQSIGELMISGSAWRWSLSWFL
ncbi:hypothetical protein CK247_31745, partial [Klebsiella pneumoniae]